MSLLENPSLPKAIHATPYAAISPSRPELSQKGRAIYVTGGSEGIGLAMPSAKLKPTSLFLLAVVLVL
jgi:hypothetical protein